MTDPRVMPKEEREILIQMLNKIDPGANYTETLEEEIIDPYDTTMKRMKAYSDKEYARKLVEELVRNGTV